MAFVMQLRSRCKKDCHCENKNKTTLDCSCKSMKPTNQGALINSSSGKCDGVSSPNNPTSPPVIIKDRKTKSHTMKKNLRGKMKSTKENQNCKGATKKANNKRACPDSGSKTDAEIPVRVRKLLRSGSREQTKCVHHKSVAQTMVRPKPKKPAATVIEEVPISETVPHKPSRVVKLAKERTSCRRNPKRKCVLNGKGTARQVRSKTALKRQVDELPDGMTNKVCDTNQCTNDTVEQEPSTSASYSAADIAVETQNITAKTKEVEREVGELQEQLEKENAQIAKLTKLLAKRQTVRNYVDRRKDQVRQAESKKLMRQLDKKESQMEERTTQLERRLHAGAQSNQKEMQKLKKHLIVDWQRKVNKTQSAITKMRHELRTKAVSWKNEKEALELKYERDQDAQKKIGSRHNFYRVCEKRLKKKIGEWQKQKLEVQKSAKTEAEKAAAVQKMEDELIELRMYLNLLAMSPEEYLRESAKRKEREKLGAIIEEDLQCTICSEILMQAIVLNCSHTFCKHCITRWTKRKDHCPVCRTTITSKFNLENLDRFINKIVNKFDNAFKERRKKALEDRKEQEKQLRAQIETGYFDEQSDDDSSDDDFWDVWDDDDDDDLSIDLDDEDDEGGIWEDWDDDLLGGDDDDDDDDDDNDAISSDDDDENDFGDVSDGSEDYDCVIS